MNDMLILILFQQDYVLMVTNQTSPWDTGYNLKTLQAYRHCNILMHLYKPGNQGHILPLGYICSLVVTKEIVVLPLIASTKEIVIITKRRFIFIKI